MGGASKVKSLLNLGFHRCAVLFEENFLRCLLEVCLIFYGVFCCIWIRLLRNLYQMGVIKKVSSVQYYNNDHKF